MSWFWKRKKTVEQERKKSPIDYYPIVPMDQATLYTLGLCLTFSKFMEQWDRERTEPAIKAIMKELARRDEEWSALAQWREERERYWQTYWEALRELRAAHAWRTDLVWMRREDMYES
jgi:hypothetical protein